MAMVNSTMIQLGTEAPDFALPDTDGRIVRKSDFAGKPLLVAFICNHCPFVKHLADKLADAIAEWQEQGVGVVAIMSNNVQTHPDDSPEKMRAEKQQRRFTFPYLYDETQDIAKAYQAACTPDFFLFDSDHKLYYRGQFDSTRPEKGQPTGEDLDNAVKKLLAGEPAPQDQYPSVGCNIKWKQGNEPDYARG
jgi:peroxiredoxin